MAEILWDAHAALKDPASYIPKEKYPMMHAAVLAACDAIDGLKDGVIDDPTRCHFDPKTIQCRAEDAPTCLTAAQVEAARKIYSPVKNPRTGAEIFPGLEPGSELYWGMGLAAGPDPMSIGTDYFKYIVFKNPNWDYKTFDFDKDVALADAMDNGADNAIDPNLKAFFGRGGKLLMYHGWADMLVAPSNTVNYYTSVVRAMGGAAKVNDSMRLFMEPGVGHCAGGEGPSNFDRLAVMERWVEQKHAPDQIVASRNPTATVPASTRPLCPYPQAAIYKGTGDTNDAANFTCGVR
jgi:feruloyl esterase